ncbi:MAG: pyridoxine 5'-phosphate synthase [Nitrospirae bacterium]|nr:pyridoxine 5'-phosphate synthase [Candidatus Manganitrophaceae bacterium]
MLKLGVNIDHVATLREARKGISPEPVTAASLAELAGADGIVVHLREDRRHIQDRDLHLLREVIQTKLCLEMAATPEMVKIASEIRPELVSLVPERREELTTEGGLDVISTQEALFGVIETLHAAGIAVALFIDPEANQIKAAQKVAADFVEIHTGAYANAKGDARRGHLKDLVESAKLAVSLGLKVNAGHGLDYMNVLPVAQIPEVEELNIGHSIIARAVLVGIGAAVSEMKSLIRLATRSSSVLH